MKTNLKTNRNRIQETILKSFIALTIIILSASVSGQNFWASNDRNYFNLVQLVAASEKSEAEILRTTAFTLTEQESEEMLKVEDWMTSENHFGMFIEVENETDNPLELEEWMTNDFNFFREASETDADLELESWMINEHHFVGSYNTGAAEEEPLKLEEWMIDENNFSLRTEKDEPLKLEAWMVAENFLD